MSLSDAGVWEHPDLDAPDDDRMHPPELSPELNALASAMTALAWDDLNTLDPDMNGKRGCRCGIPCSCTLPCAHLTAKRMKALARPCAACRRGVRRTPAFDALRWFLMGCPFANYRLVELWQFSESTLYRRVLARYDMRPRDISRCAPSDQTDIVRQ